MSQKAKIPIWFWIVATLFLVWNAMGVWNYIDQVTVTEEGLEALGERMKNFLDTRPAWATGGFAVAVWGGLIASILLLMRKSLAVSFFIISLLGALVSMSYDFLGSDVELSGEEIGISLFVIVVGLITVWVSRMARSKGWTG